MGPTISPRLPVWLTCPDRPAPADVVLVLDGGDSPYRLDAALDLFNRGFGSHLLVSQTIPDTTGILMGDSVVKAQAKKIVDQFARDGLLAEMHNIANKKIAYPKGPAYTLHITGLPGAELYADLGWGLPMLRRLEGIRSALDGPAAKTMDLVRTAIGF